jgi:energy-coupling factor transporter ATP-binding protein EcfA2/Xaa-Pro aminopeptidase
MLRRPLGFAWWMNKGQAALGIAAALTLLAALLTLGGLAKVTKRKGPFRTSAASFIGREEEVREIAGDIEDHRLIFLTGQSGCGKSTLIEHGVAPAMSSPRRLVLLCQYLGDDWETGPAEALANRLNRVLSQDDRIKLGIQPQAVSLDVVQTLRACPERLDREPVLIFDQFDDYQTLHVSRFVRRSRVLSPERLRVENAFWRGIAALLEDRLIRCVFVTRDDAHPRLRAVEFLPPEEFELESLDQRFAEEYLLKVSEDVLESADATWPALRRRVLRDLERDGKVLPIRLVSIATSLEDLPSLTLAEYERAGGLIGLEARSLEKRIRRAAARVDLSFEQVLPLLVFLVERRKTVPRSLKEVSAKLPNFETGTEQASTLLEDLEEERIVRSVSAQQGRDVFWKLYHDYLSEPVEELQRRAGRWQFALDESFDRYQGARGFVARFRALAPPVLQLRFWWQRWRGRIRFGRATGYMRRSLLRLFLNPGTLVLALAVWLGVREVDRRAGEEARRLLENYTSSTEGTPERGRATWRLSSAPKRVKSAFVKETLSSEIEAKIVGKDSRIVRALAGPLAASTLPRWLTDSVDRSCAGNQVLSFAQVVLCDHWMSAGGATPNKHADFLMAEMQQRKAPGELSKLAVNLGAFRSHVPEPKAGELAEKLVAEMRQNDPGELFTLGRALEALGSRVPEPKAGELAEKLVAEMRQRKNPQELSILGRALGALASRVPDPKAGDLAEKLVAEMGQRNTPDELFTLGRALGALASRVPEPKAGELAEKLVAEMRQRKDPRELSTLAGALGALASRVPEPKVVESAEKLLAEMRQRKDPGELSTLARALGAFGSRVPEPKVVESAEKLLAEMRQRRDPDQLSPLAGALGALGSRVPEPKVVESAEKLLAEMRQRKDPLELSKLARALGTLGSRVPEP